MKYDDEYNSYKFSTKDMEFILDALSYTHWNDKSLSESDRDYIDGLYQSLDNSGVKHNMILQG
jgi:hypothetical protein